MHLLTKNRLFEILFILSLNLLTQEVIADDKNFFLRAGFSSSCEHEAESAQLLYGYKATIFSIKTNFSLGMNYDLLFSCKEKIAEPFQEEKPSQKPLDSLAIFPRIAVAALENLSLYAGMSFYPFTENYVAYPILGLDFLFTKIDAGFLTPCFTLSLEYSPKVTTVFPKAESPAASWLYHVMRALELGMSVEIDF